MWTLAELDYYVRSIPDPRWKRTLDSIPDVSLFNAIKPMFNQSRFIAGNKVQQQIKTNIPLRGKAHGENIAIPTGGMPGHAFIEIPLREVIDVATITSQALDMADGQPGSWGKPLDDAHDDMMNVSFPEFMRFNMLGTGEGKVARIVSAAVINDDDDDKVRITCDNSYTDFGWDNVQFVQEGMQVEIAHNASVISGAECLDVINVSFGDRNNGAATTGYFDVLCADASAATALQAAIADNDVVYRYGTHAVSAKIGTADALPRGMFYFWQDGTLLTDQVQTSYFGLDRSAYKSLRATIVQGASPGTPEDWDMSTLLGEVVRTKKGSGKGTVTDWFCNANLALAIGRRSDAEHSVQVVVNSQTGAASSDIAMRDIPKRIKGPYGWININVDEAIPNNCLGMVDRKDLVMHQKSPFDYKRLYGGVWGPTKGDAYTNLECLYGGWVQFSADRCDNMTLIQDLQDNI
jgi:hypothetical protein